MTSKGKLFEYEIAKSFREFEADNNNFMWFKIPDTSLMRYATGSSYATTLRVPSDFMAVYNGTPYFIECKSSRNPTSYTLDYIKPHQIDTLLKAEQCGATSWILLNRRNGRTLSAYALKPKTIYDYVNTYEFKSIKWGIVEADSIPLNRLNGGYNIRELFNNGR